MSQSVPRTLTRASQVVRIERPRFSRVSARGLRWEFGALLEGETEAAPATVSGKSLPHDGHWCTAPGRPGRDGDPRARRPAVASTSLGRGARWNACADGLRADVRARVRPTLARQPRMCPVSALPNRSLVQAVSVCRSVRERPRSAPRRMSPRLALAAALSVGTPFGEVEVQDRVALEERSVEAVGDGAAPGRRPPPARSA